MRVCTKCGASAGNLIRRQEGGSFSISCCLCGNLMYGDGHLKEQQEKGEEIRLKACSQREAEMAQWRAHSSHEPPPFVKVFGAWLKNKN